MTRISALGAALLLECLLIPRPTFAQVGAPASGGTAEARQEEAEPTDEHAEPAPETAPSTSDVTSETAHGEFRLPMLTGVSRTRQR